jgi:hypothetical protein
MTKRQEIDDPNSCLNRGPDTELKFVIRDVDITAPDTVRDWCRRRIEKGKNTPKDAQITEALEWADKVQAILEKRPQTKQPMGGLTVLEIKKQPMGGLTVLEIKTAYERHHKRNGMSFNSVLQQLMGSDDVDWDRFKVNHPLFCDYWGRKGWSFCTQFFLDWVNTGCCPPPPEPTKTNANTRAARIGNRE